MLLHARMRTVNVANQVQSDAELGTPRRQRHATRHVVVGDSFVVSEALKVLRTAADLGDVPAQVSLGSVLLCGHGCPQDIPLGLGWLRKAAQAGSRYAQVKLVEVCAISGSLAERWLRAAAAGNDTLAMTTLGLQHSRGRFAGGWAEAVRWWQLAAELGNPVAQRNLGLAYLEGAGVVADRPKALGLLKDAEAQGYSDAHRMLVALGDHDGNAPRATHILHDAASAGNIEAQFDLGCAYAEGQGGPETDGALRLAWWWRLTGTGRMAWGQGEVLTQDVYQAFAWWQSAARAGLAEAQCNVALAHWRGVGVRCDEHLALYWFLRAAGQGSTVALVYLQSLDAEGFAVERMSSWSNEQLQVVEDAIQSHNAVVWDGGDDGDTKHESTLTPQGAIPIENLVPVVDECMATRIVDPAPAESAKLGRLRRAARNLVRAWRQDVSFSRAPVVACRKTNQAAAKAVLANAGATAVEQVGVGGSWACMCRVRCGVSVSR